MDFLKYDIYGGHSFVGFESSGRVLASYVHRGSGMCVHTWLVYTEWILIAEFEFWIANWGLSSLKVLLYLWCLRFHRHNER